MSFEDFVIKKCIKKMTTFLEAAVWWVGGWVGGMGSMRLGGPVCYNGPTYTTVLVISMMNMSL